LGKLHRFGAAIDVLWVGARQACDVRVLGAAGDLADRLKVAFGGDGKAGLDDVDAHVIEHLGDRELFLERHGGAGTLLAIAQGGVEYDNAVLLGLFSFAHLKVPFGSCAVVWALRGFLNSRATPECPGANRPDGPQGPIRSRSPPRRRVGRDAAGIAGAASAAPPRTPIFSLRISIAVPFGSRNPRPKPLTVRCRGRFLPPF